jgi:RsiW-degrading membrane proteinase PrsW (M82 family)
MHQVIAADAGFTGRPQFARLRGSAWVLVLVVGVGLFEAMRRALVVTGNEALAPTLVVLGALVMPATVVTLIYGRRLRFSVSGGVLATVAACGGVVGVLVAGMVEFETLQRLGIGGKLGVAVIEEIAKLIIPALLLVFGPWRRIGDGLIIGVASGAGFAALETMGYAFTTSITSHGSLAAVDGDLMVRGLLSPAGNMAWTGIAATGLWCAKQQRFSWRGTWTFVSGMTVAIALHTAWDGLVRRSGCPRSRGRRNDRGAAAVGSLISPSGSRNEPWTGCCWRKGR